MILWPGLAFTTAKRRRTAAVVCDRISYDQLLARLPYGGKITDFHILFKLSKARKSSKVGKSVSNAVISLQVKLERPQRARPWANFFLMT